MNSLSPDTPALSFVDHHYRGRTHPLQLTGQVGALSETTIRSNRITFKCVIDSIVVQFPPGTDFLVHVYPLISFDPSVSTSGLPPGMLLLSTLSPTPYLTGDSQFVILRPAMPLLSRGTYLKAHLNNTDGFTHTISIQAAITELISQD